MGFPVCDLPVRGAPVMLSEAKHLWLARSFGLRPQDDGRRGLVPFGGPVLQDDGWRGLVPFGGPVLSCAGGLRASGRGQAGAPVMLSEAKHLWLARSFGLRPQDDGWRGLVPFGGPVLSCAGGLRAGGRGQVGGRLSC